MSPALCGTWKLISEELRDEHMGISPYQRPPSRGYLTYTLEGFVFWIRSDQERASFAKADFRAASLTEKAAAADSFRAYVGRYEVRGDQVIHHIELSLFPNWASTQQTRSFRLSGDLLELTSSPLMESNQKVVGILRFERVR
jgi:hypothetical protein